MEQSHQLFESPELVELIILQLSPYDIVKVQLVAKMWRDLINRKSERMNLAKCAKPSKIEAQELPLCAVVPPVYQEDLGLSPRIIDGEDHYTFDNSGNSVTGIEKKGLQISLTKSRRIESSNYGPEDFITVPRCQAVGLTVVFYNKGWVHIESTVYTRCGVTFGDVLFAIDAMTMSQSPHGLTMIMTWNQGTRLPVQGERGSLPASPRVG
ncbi:hypothetical protein BDY17DRAFT_83456 [Neohortaea acidophila]|uniref:F-box domain-containing protein n=1 Tax=Neohortaea acidophila TaxID=245834 RepID=A0A6A6Q2M7_9PEZI|nr:uncharacterized protein BDY17DRAFT_83456 [Neohortaea acidophila]KAF2486650.1 hypothetical protein BDY17DRAFT_83456 [Neohortaea acidophila]